MSTGSRTYDGTRRRAAAAATRAEIVAAGTELFSSRGWAGTSMRDVARAAGVAVETVYSTVGSKADLLRAALDVAIVGDDAAVPLAERPEFQALALGDLRTRLRAAADLIVAISTRTARLIRALDAAAAIEPDLAALGLEMRALQRQSHAEALGLVARRTVTHHEAETLIALCGEETYLLLTEAFGWSATQVADLIADTLMHVLDLAEED